MGNRSQRHLERSAVIWCALQVAIAVLGAVMFYRAVHHLGVYPCWRHKLNKYRLRAIIGLVLMFTAGGLAFLYYF